MMPQCRYPSGCPYECWHSCRAADPRTPRAMEKSKPRKKRLTAWALFRLDGTYTVHAKHPIVTTDTRVVELAGEYEEPWP